jgi:hypothetical protein
MAVKGLFDAIAAMQFKLAKKLIEGGVNVSIAIAGVTLKCTLCHLSCHSTPRLVPVFMSIHQFQIISKRH